MALVRREKAEVPTALPLFDELGLRDRVILAELADDAMDVGPRSAVLRPRTGFQNPALRILAERSLGRLKLLNAYGTSARAWMTAGPEQPGSRPALSIASATEAESGDER